MATRFVPLLLLLTAAAFAQTGSPQITLPGNPIEGRGPRNLDFKEGAPGAVPAGWFVSEPLLALRYSAELRTEGCQSGRCAVVIVPPEAPERFGNLMQTFDAYPYRGKTIRLRASVRLERVRPGDRAQMWLRVDRADRQTGLFDNMRDRPVTSAKWQPCEIKGRVDKDAALLNFGVISIGAGRAWIDNVSFEIVSKK